MAIRDEYQQLETEIKKEEERSRILDLLSVGVITPDDSYIYFAAYAYKEKGLYVDDLYMEIGNEIDDIIEILENKDKEFNLNDISLSDDYIIAPESTHFEEIFPKSLNLSITIFDELYNKLHSYKKLRKDDTELLKRISDTKAQCEQLMLLYKEAVNNKSSISIDDIQKYKVQTFYKQFNDNNLNDEIERTEVKLGKQLSQKERIDYCNNIRYRLLYENIVRPFAALVIYLSLIDERNSYRAIISQYMSESLSDSSDYYVTIEINNSDHTIKEIFTLLTKYPKRIVTSVLGYIKDGGFIDFLEYSRIIDAINTYDLNAFISSLNRKLVEFLDSYYFVIKLGYSLILYYQSQNKQECMISISYIIRLYKNTGICSPQIEVFDNLVSSEANIKESSEQLINLLSNQIWHLVGLITHYYYKYKHLLLTSDQECFDRLFTQEPYKQICDQALSGYNKLSKESILNIFGFVSTIFEQNDEETQNAQTIVEENNSVEDISTPEQHENKMIDNPFDGLKREATKQCSGDKKGYVSMFIDYLIYRGYIDAENKDAYVCCLCDEMISEDTLEHLKYNTTNKEGIRNANIVTILFGRLTKFTANNQIVVDGKEISRGSIYFNKGQIDNGELEEWCLFWPFLTGRNKEGKETFKKLFQSALRSQDSKMENALKRVTSFIEDYEAAKSQNPSITKLEFIKKRH